MNFNNNSSIDTTKSSDAQQKLVDIILYYAKELIQKCVSVFAILKKDNKREDIIKIIRETLIPEILQYINQSEADTKVHHIEIRKLIPCYPDIPNKIKWQQHLSIEQQQKLQNSSNSIMFQIKSALTTLANLLNNNTVQKFVLDTIQTLIEEIYKYQCDLYSYSIQIITTKKYDCQYFSQIFSKELQEISSPTEKYSDFVTENEKTDPNFHQQVNYKDIIFKSNTRSQVKKAEIMLFLKHYASFYEKFNTLFVNIGRQLLPESIVRFLPQEPSVFFTSPIILLAIHQYLFKHKFNTICTNVLASKEFMKVIVTLLTILQRK